MIRNLAWPTNVTNEVEMISVIRLGKKKEKEKDAESKSQNVDGIFRLICSPRTQNIPRVGEY